MFFFQSLILALTLVSITGRFTSCATFRYISGTTETTYTEGKTTVNGTTYDGTFTNAVFDPFAMIFRQFSGLFSVTDGSLGEAVAVAAVQTNPSDRILLGEEGIARTEYFTELQNVALIPEAITFPPSLREFDFKFAPAPVANAPTVLARGWSVEKVNEPGILVAMGFFYVGLMIIRKHS